MLGPARHDATLAALREQKREMDKSVAIATLPPAAMAEGSAVKVPSGFRLPDERG
jgi:hypothetical protein